MNRLSWLRFIDNFMNRIKQQVGTLVTSAYFWIGVIAVVLVVVGILLSVVYWDELPQTANFRNLTTTNTPQHSHCGLDPQSIGAVCDAGNNKPTQPINTPSPLMGEESKVRVK